MANETEDTTEEIAPEILARAKELKHQSREDWVKSGKPASTWRDEAAFVEFHDNLQPVMKQANKELREKLDAAEKRYANLEGSVAEMVKLTRSRMEAEFKAREDYYKKVVSENRKVGDFEAAEKAQAELDDLRENRPEPPKDIAAASAAPTPGRDGLPLDTNTRKIIDEWVAEGNDWWYSSTKLRKYGQQVANDVRAETPNLVGRPFIEEVGRRVRADWPQEFDNMGSSDDGDGGEDTGATRTRRANTVEATSFSGSGSRTSRGAPSYDRLSATEKAECDRCVKLGLFKTRDAWIKIYNAYEG